MTRIRRAGQPLNTLALIGPDGNILQKPEWKRMHDEHEEEDDDDEDDDDEDDDD